METEGYKGDSLGERIWILAKLAAGTAAAVAAIYYGTAIAIIAFG